ELNIESFEGKFYIGDTERDIQAGRRVGLKTIFVLSGKNSAEDAKKFKTKPDHVCKDLLEAARFIVNGEGGTEKVTSNQLPED
ncbi:MAG: HAD hydrolase-like protein, partial [Candidatus Omnitrophota bacterium]